MPRLPNATTRALLEAAFRGGVEIPEAVVGKPLVFALGHKRIRLANKDGSLTTAGII